MNPSSEDTQSAGPADQQSTAGASLQPGLGEMLRETREELGLTLDAVATATGLSKSFISLIETGRSDMSVGRFTRLCEFYNVRPSEVLRRMDGQALADPHRFVSPQEGSDSSFLGPPPESSTMRGVVTRYEPGARTEVSSHGGEELIYVISGRLNVYLGANSEKFELGPNDNMHYWGAVPHSFENPDPSEQAIKLTVRSELWW